MGKKLAIKCKIYRNTASHASPTWSHVDRVGDANMNLSWDEGDGSSRESVIKFAEPTQGTLEVTGKIRVDPDDTNYTAIRDAFAAKTALNLLVLDGPVDEDGSEGVRGDFKVFNFSRDESMGNVLFRDFTLKPCIPETSASAPTHVIVEGGILVESEFGEE